MSKETTFGAVGRGFARGLRPDPLATLRAEVDAVVAAMARTPEPSKAECSRCGWRAEFAARDLALSATLAHGFAHRVDDLAARVAALEAERQGGPEAA